MYWVVMRGMGRSDGSSLTGHMWLIRIGPHKAPDTLKMIFCTPRIILCNFSFIRRGRQTDEMKDKSLHLDLNSFGR